MTNNINNTQELTLDQMNNVNGGGLPDILKKAAEKINDINWDEILNDVKKPETEE